MRMDGEMMNTKISTCPNCGVEEGEFHLDCCDRELCTKCGRQVLGWGRCKGAKRGRYFHNAGYWCQRCGECMPEMIMLSDEKWKKIIAGNYNPEDVLCEKCMKFIGSFE